jgi:hypothetical protein
VCGHLYGHPSRERSVHPAASFLAALDEIRTLQPRFLVSAGDMIEETTSLQIQVLRESVLESLDFPVFNAVGNHDLTDRAAYQAQFGRTFFAFDYGSESYVILDSELSAGRIEGEQKEFLLAKLEEAGRRSEIANVFVFSHKLVWVRSTPAFRVVAEHVNSLESYADGTHFATEIEPGLRALAARKPVYWISGDIGTGASLPLFFHRDPRSPITYAATGIAETAGDAILRVRVGADATVSLEAMELATWKSLPVSEFGIERWERDLATASAPAGPARRLVASRAFWIGVGVTVGAQLGVWLLRRISRSASPPAERGDRRPEGQGLGRTASPPRRSDEP